VNQVAALDNEIRMPRQSDPQKQIAALSTTGSSFPLACEPNTLSLVHTARNLDLILLDLVGRAPPQRNRPFRAMQRLLERDHDIGFTSLPRSSRLASSKTASAKPFNPRPPPKRLEEIAESSPTKLNSTLHPRPHNGGILHLVVALPSGRWPNARLFHRAKLIYFSLLRITQDFVGFINLFEFFLCHRFVFVDIRMVFAREFKSLTNFVITSSSRL
jgi:hypothetical protein